MRTYASATEAEERLVSSFKKRQRLESKDLLRFLEDLSSEPDGEHAYVLALALRGLGISEENLHGIAIEIDDGLSALLSGQSGSSCVKAAIEKVLRAVSDHHSAEQRPSNVKLRPVTEGRAKASSQGESTQQKRAEAISAARECGSHVLRSVHERYKRELFYSMAALALYWTIFELSTTHGSSGPELEQDVVRMFLKSGLEVELFG